LWDTTGTAVVHALGAERRVAGAVSSGLALTLVVVVDEKRVAEAELAATRAAAQHPCRLLVVVRRRPDAPEPRLDAEVLIGGRLGPGEAVVMRMYGRLSLHAESVVLPLLAPDAPVVTWWYGEPPHLIAHDPLGVFADRRVTDVSFAPDPLAALATRAKDYVPGDTDLAWTRTTQWRALCASAFDSVEEQPRRAVVTGSEGDGTRALLAGWLASRLGVKVKQVDVEGPPISSVEIHLAGGHVVSLVVGEGRTTTLSHTGQPDRTLPLPTRELGDLLAEELQRLDADETYAEALAALNSGKLGKATGRTHVWVDPVLDAVPESVLVEGPRGS
jgi:glucose-6-phosphate dehydrogenase assembly protein OpcA